MKKIIITLALAFLTNAAHSAEYRIDPDHSAVMFRVRHLVGHVTGSFDKFSGSFVYDPKKPEVWKTSATIDAASINTKVEQRDKHLRSEDFFDAQKYPLLRFVSTQISNVKGDHAKLQGKLTILDTTKTVTFNLEIGGVQKGSDGREHAAFTATTRLNRKDFGLTWNDTIETGGVLVGDTVDVTLEIEGIREK